MRQIGKLPTKTLAKRFSDHLWRLGVGHEVEEGSGGDWLVWIAADDQLEPMEALLERFARDPDAEEFRGASGEARRLKRRERREAKRSRHRVIDGRTTLNRAEFLELRPVTVTLIGASFIIFIASQMGANHSVLRHFTFADYVIKPDLWGRGSLHHEGWNSILSGQVWRIFTPAIIHFGFIHLAFNMAWLITLGTQIETRQGRGFLLALFVATQVISTPIEYMVSGPLFGGMSGVVYAMFGHVWICHRNRSPHDYHLDERTVVLMLGWLVLCFTGILGPIANMSHLLGLMIGMATGSVTSGQAQRWLSRIRGR